MSVKFLSFRLCLFIVTIYSGQYFVPLAKHEDPSKLAQDDNLAKQLWEFSEAVVKEKLGTLW